MYLIKHLNKPICLYRSVSKIMDRMANSADPDQTAPLAVDLGLYCLLRLSVPASVAQLDANPAGDQKVVCFDPHQVWPHSFLEIDHEIFADIYFL